MVADVEVGVHPVVGDQSIAERPNFDAVLVEFVAKAPGPCERDRGEIRALHSFRYP